LYFHHDGKLNSLIAIHVSMNFTLFSKGIQIMYISYSSILIIINDHTFLVSLNGNGSTEFNSIFQTYLVRTVGEMTVIE